MGSNPPASSMNVIERLGRIDGSGAWVMDSFNVGFGAVPVLSHHREPATGRHNHHRAAAMEPPRVRAAATWAVRCGTEAVSTSCWRMVFPQISAPRLISADPKITRPLTSLGRRSEPASSEARVNR